MFLELELISFILLVTHRNYCHYFFLLEINYPFRNELPLPQESRKCLTGCFSAC